MAKQTTAPPAPGTTAPPVPTTGGTPATNAPAAPTTTTTATPTVPLTTPLDPNPVELQLFRYTKPDDSIFILARVTDIHDLGMKSRTVVFSSGRHGRDDEKTDKNGVCEFPFTITKTDRDERLTAMVSGIATPAVLHIPAKRVPKSQMQIDRDAKNNKRAKRLIKAMILVWLAWTILVMFFGLGNPLISFQRTELTNQEKWYNQVPGVRGSPREAKAELPIPFWKAGWQKPFLLILLALSALTLCYSVLALREEVAEALRNGWSKVLDRRGHMAFAKDPALQRWLELVGLLKTARARREISAPTDTSGSGASTTTSTETPQPTRHKNTFWELLRSDLISDFIMEVLPGLLKKIFR